MPQAHDRKNAKCNRRHRHAASRKPEVNSSACGSKSATALAMHQPSNTSVIVAKRQLRHTSLRSNERLVCPLASFR